MPETTGHQEPFKAAVVISELIDTPAVAEVKHRLESARPTFEHLTQELAAGIRDNRWGTLVGDDRSGRLPTLFIRRLTERWADETNTVPPQTCFVAAGQVDEDTPGLDIIDSEMKKNEVMTAYLEQLPFDRSKRALVVTEFVYQGYSMHQLTGLLEDTGVDCDVAVLESRRDKSQTSRDIMQTAGASLYIGQTEVSGAGMLKGVKIMEDAAGVERLPLDPALSRLSGVDQDAVRAAREQIKLMADQLFEQHIKETEHNA